MFSQPSVKALLARYSLIELYTDKVPPRLLPTTSADENREFQIGKFGDARLPLYVILQTEMDGKYREVSRYAEGKINDVSAFVDFLQKPLTTYTSAQAAKAPSARN